MALQDIASEKFSNKNLNSVGSNYGAEYNHATSLLVQKEVNKVIFDSMPKQFMDLKLLNMVGFEHVDSDEFHYQEMGDQRLEIVSNETVAGVTHPAMQTFGVTSLDGVSTNTLIVYPNGQKGNIFEIDSTNSKITVVPFTNSTLPAVTSGDSFANQSPVDHTGSDGFTTYFRATTIERTNFVQFFNMAIRYDEVELYKMQKTGTTSNFLVMETKAMMNHHRTGLANTLWLGEKGEIKTEDGKMAKTTQGVFTAMLEAGSPSAIGVTELTLVDAFESVVMQSEYGDYGDTRFAFLTPELHRLLSKKYKEEFTQYAPDDTFAMLNLKQVNIGSSNIVLIPMARFKQRASFPQAFEKRIIILDIENIKPCNIWGERSGVTDALKDGTPKRYSDVYVDCNMGIKFNNPLGCAYVEMA